MRKERSSREEDRRTQFTNLLNYIKAKLKEDKSPEEKKKLLEEKEAIVEALEELDASSGIANPSSSLNGEREGSTRNGFAGHQQVKQEEEREYDLTDKRRSLTKEKEDQPNEQEEEKTKAKEQQKKKTRRNEYQSNEQQQEKKRDG